MRLDKIAGSDLNLFDFDYDLTWAGFFLSADETVYGRYGGRDAASADSRLSLAGLRYALQAALERHRARPPGAVPAARPRPQRVEDYDAARRGNRRECIHCHQVYEYRRADARAAGTWDRESRWTYPLPENVGLTLELDRGDRVQEVRPKSPAADAGLRPGDRLQAVNRLPVASTADVQYALHRAPARGAIPVTWQRAGRAYSATLNLADGWRKTNVTWRPSLLDVLPSVPLFGDDLDAAEKKALGLPEARLAFRQDSPVPAHAKKQGVQAGDIILGVDGLELNLTQEKFFGYVRTNYLTGDKITLNVLRGGKRVDVPLVLK